MSFSGEPGTPEMYEPLQIIYLHPHFVSDGGAGRMVLATAERLADRGHEVHVVCIRAVSSIVGKVRDKVHFHETGGPREILDNLPCGRLCNSVDANQIADALMHFLSMSDESFSSVSEHATQRAKAFSWDNASLQIEAALMNSVSAMKAECRMAEKG